MRYILSLFLLFCTILTFTKDHIRIFEGIVIKVSDGDSMQIKDHPGSKVKVRLDVIDAPETEVGREIEQQAGVHERMLVVAKAWQT